MIGEAAAAYVDRNWSRAIQLCQDVIQIEPAAHTAWNTLALVHEDLGDIDTSLKLKIMAAHLQGDSDLWRELGRSSRCANHPIAPRHQLIEVTCLILVTQVRCNKHSIASGKPSRWIPEM